MKNEHRNVAGTPAGCPLCCARSWRRATRSSGWSASSGSSPRWSCWSPCSRTSSTATSPAQPLPPRRPRTLARCLPTAQGAELAPLTFTITVKLEELTDTPELRLGFTLPCLYPRAAPLVVAGIPGLTRGAREKLAAALMATGKERTEDEGEDGEECVCELVQQAQELAAEMVVAEAEATATAGGGGAEDEGGATQCVVKIDHMNDSKNYMQVPPASQSIKTSAGMPWMPSDR